MLLGEGLEAGSLVAQFEQLYRRKPGLTVTEARRPDNEKKNRYRDISPCECSCVFLFTFYQCSFIIKRSSNAGMFGLVFSLFIYF